jgi:xanthine dehydrogenase/oxidase
MTAEAFLTIGSESNKREIEISKFFLGYRKVDLNGDEVLLKVNIPLPESKLEIIHSYKQAKRRDDDIAIVNAAFKVTLDENYVISKLNLSYGGLAPTTIFLNDVKEKSKGLKWGNEENLTSIYDAILEKINLPYSVPGGMPTYRRTLSVSFFTKFWHQIIKELDIKTESKSDLKIDVDEIERKISTSVHDFGESIEGSDPSIGTCDPNVNGLKQTTGVAKYVDDIPKQAGELFAGAVLSSKPHALLLKVDPSKALSLEGVHAYVDYKDLKHNSYGIITKDDEFFASKEVNFVGQLIGLIIADSKSLARKAASLVQIDYQPLPYVLTIEDAIEHNSFFAFDKGITKGVFDSNTFKIDENDNEIVLEGKLRVGGQEHFYLETHGCLAIPKNEDNEMEIFSSTQSPTEVQKEVAEALGIPANRVVCKVKRLGGGFGGKETRATFVAVVAAAAAKKLKRPIRFILDRDIDMLITGTRHPFVANYKIRITKDGIFKAYDIDLISNAGYSLDLSPFVTEVALLTVDNVYNFPKLHVRGRLAKTNIASNTA